MQSHEHPAQRHRYTLMMVLAWAGFVALYGLAVIDVVRGPWDHDGGYYLFQSSLVAEGWRPYLDYESFKPPLMDLLNALPVWMGLDRYWLAVAIPGAWIAINAMFSVRLARTIGYDRAPSILAGMGFLILCIQNGGNHVTHEHPVVLFSLLAIITLVGPRPLSVRAAFSVGVVLACAILAKQNGVVALLPVGALLVERRGEISRRTAQAGLAGFAIPFLVILAWLRFDTDRIGHSLLDRLLSYAEASSGPEFSIAAEFANNTPTAIFLVVTLGAALGGLVSGSRQLLVAASALGAILQFLPRLIRDYPHYTLNVWPFALLVILIVGRARLETTGRLTRAVAAATVILFGSSYLFGQSFEKWKRPGLLSSAFLPAAIVVRENTSDHDRFRMYAAEPIIPFLAHRLPDEINAPASVMAGIWDGSHLVSYPLPRKGPVVVVDRGEDWPGPLRERLVSQKFRVVLDEVAFDTRRQKLLRITVFLGP